MATGITEERQWQFTLFGVNLESQDNFSVSLQLHYD